MLKDSSHICLMGTACWWPIFLCCKSKGSKDPRVSRWNDYTLPDACSHVSGRPLDTIHQLNVICRRHRKPAPRSSNFSDARNPLRVKGSLNLVQTRLEEKWCMAPVQRRKNCWNWVLETPSHLLYWQIQLTLPWNVLLHCSDSRHLSLPHRCFQSLPRLSDSLESPVKGEECTPEGRK